MLRVAKTWSERLYPHGNFSIAAKAITDYAADFQAGSACTQIGSNYNIEWELLGPKNTPAGSTARGMGQIHRIAFHPNYNIAGTDDEQTIYAATGFGGLFVSTNNGDLWQNMGTDNGLPQSSVSGIAIVPNSPNIMFISTGTADEGIGESDDVFFGFSGLLSYDPVLTIGVYKTTNANAANPKDVQWHNINGAVFINGQSAGKNLLQMFDAGGTIHQIALDPENSNRLFIVSSQGVFKCENPNAAVPQWHRILIEHNPFSPTATPRFSQFRGIAFKPGNSQVIYVAGKHLYRSTNGGNTWETLTNSDVYQNSPNCANYTNACFFPPLSSTHLLDLTTQPTVSEQELNAVSSSFRPFRSNVVVSQTPGAEENIYWYVVGIEDYVDTTPKATRAAYLYQYSAGTWKKVFHRADAQIDPATNAPDAFNYVSPAWLALTVHPTDPDNIIWGHTRVRKNTNTTLNGFDISEYSSSGFHADVHALEFAPNTPPNTPLMLWCGNDGGVSVKDYTNNSSSFGGWTFKHNGLAVSKSWSFDDYEKNPQLMGIANQDADCNFSDDGGNSWQTSSRGGDGYGLEIDNRTGDAYFICNSSIVLFKKPFHVSTDSPIYNGINDNTTERHFTLDFGMTNHPFTNEMYFSVIGGVNNVAAPMVETYNPVLTTWQNYLAKPQILPHLAPDPAFTYNSYSVKEIVFSTENPNKGYFYNNSSGRVHDPTGWIQTQPQLHKIEGTTITQLTLNLPSYQHLNSAFQLQNYRLPITGIAIDPDDDDHLWVCFSGYQDTIKVHESFNGGLTWTNADPNGTLCNLPMNGIVYQPGTNDRLYVATDAGVFVSKKISNGSGGTTTVWERYGDVPNVRVTQIKINSCINKLRIATFGRGVWQADLLPREVRSNEQLITQNMTWDTERVLTNSLRIKSGSTLTVTNTVNMPKDAYILIEPGARLLLDGGTLTNACGETWEGVVVEGNSLLAQSSSQQGVLEMRNGAVIEHARTAVQVHGGNIAGNKNGGMVLATNSTFRNNQNGVAFGRYRHPLSPNITNRSYFTNCSFVVDNNLRFANEANPFKTHLTVWGIVALQVRGCTFANDNTTLAENQRGRGIWTFDASTHIAPMPNTTQGNTFRGLYTGVLTYNVSSILSPTIDRATFTDNRIGASALAVGFFKAVRSSFAVGRPAPLASFNAPVGIALINTVPFVAEQNTFTHITGTANRNIGIWANNLGINATPQLYKNSFTQLRFGNLVNGLNGSSAQGFEDNGLKFYCNSHQSEVYDNVVTNGLAATSPATVSFRQGGDMVNNQITAAGNQFINTSNAEGHFFNNCDFSGTVAQVSYYYFNAANQNPTQNCNVQSIEAGIFNLCPDHYPAINPDATGTIGLAQLQAFKTEYYAHLSDYTRLKTRYDRLMDKGNRDSLRQVIQNTPHQNQPIRRMQDSLEVIAPYLTDTMLVAIATDGLFSRSQVKSILSEVPHATLESTLLQMLRDTLAYTPLTLNDLDWLLTKAQQNIKKPKAKDRTALETAMGYHIAEMERLATEIIFEYLKDTINTDSVTAWLQRFSALEMQYKLIDWYWQNGQYLTALQHFGTIRQNYTFTPEQKLEHSLLFEWKNMLYSIETDNRALSELSVEEVRAIEHIANKPETAGLARLQARSILNFFYGYSYEDEPKLPATAPALRQAETDTTTEQPITIAAELKPALTLSPNPANNWVKVQYVLLAEPTEAAILITNTQGSILYQQAIANTTGELVYDSKNLPSGVYFVVLKCRGQEPLVQKLIIIR